LIDGTGNIPAPNAAAGGYILPGLIDTPVHVMLQGVDIIRDITTPFSMHKVLKDQRGKLM
jgi:hypothetical protein